MKLDDVVAVDEMILKINILRTLNDNGVVMTNEPLTNLPKIIMF